MVEHLNIINAFILKMSRTYRKFYQSFDDYWKPKGWEYYHNRTWKGLGPKISEKRARARYKTKIRRCCNSWSVPKWFRQRENRDFRRKEKAELYKEIMIEDYVGSFTYKRDSAYNYY